MAFEHTCIYDIVFSILAFNRGILALLHTRLVSWSDEQCIGDIFLGMVRVCCFSQWVVFTFHNRFVLNYMLLLLQFVVQYNNYNHRACTV